MMVMILMSKKNTLPAASLCANRFATLHMVVNGLQHGNSFFYVPLKMYYHQCTRNRIKHASYAIRSFVRWCVAVAGSSSPAACSMVMVVRRCTLNCSQPRIIILLHINGMAWQGSSKVANVLHNYTEAAFFLWPANQSSNHPLCPCTMVTVSHSFTWTNHENIIMTIGISISISLFFTTSSWTSSGSSRRICHSRA